MLCDALRVGPMELPAEAGQHVSGSVKPGMSGAGSITDTLNEAVGSFLRWLLRPPLAAPPVQVGRR